MKNLKFSLIMLIFTAALLITVNGCKKDEEAKALSLSTLTAGAIDLNGATAPNNVPVAPVFTATFSTSVDAATATSSNITLMRDYDDAAIATTITVSGSTVTITPTENLASGALHALNFGAGLKSTEGATLGTAVNRTFSTAGFFSPAGMVAYWNFEDNADDQIGTYDPSATVDISYVAGRKSEAGKAADFNGTTSIIEYANGDQLMTNDFTLTFWVKAAAVKQHFVIGLGAFYGFQFEIGGDAVKLAASYGYENGGDTTFAQDLWWNGDGLTKDNGGWQGTTVNRDMTTSGGVRSLFDDVWTHVVCMYDSQTKIGVMYVNGQKAKEQDFNLWNDGDKQKIATGLKYGGKEPDVVNELAFGFIQSRAGTLWDTEPWGGYDIPTSNHFDGQLDDVRIFDKVLSAAEITLMYDSEKP